MTTLSKILSSKRNDREGDGGPRTGQRNMLAGSQLAAGQDFPPFGVLELEKGRGLKGQGRIGVNPGSEWREKQTMGFGYH